MREIRPHGAYPVKESHIIMRQSGPLSAVAIHRLSSLTQRQEMMLGWPCGNAEDMLRNSKDGAWCGPQGGPSPHSPELLPKLACLESGFHGPSQRFLYLLLGLGVGSRAFSSSTRLKELCSPKEQVLPRDGGKWPTQSGPLNSLPTSSSTNTAHLGSPNSSAGHWCLIHS